MMGDARDAGLTDSEWMSLIDMERDGLPVCCANVSALRDRVIDIAREGCKVSGWNQIRTQRFLQAYQWAINSHPELCESDALTKLATVVAEVAGVTLPVVGGPDKPQAVEV